MGGLLGCGEVVWGWDGARLPEPRLEREPAFEPKLFKLLLDARQDAC